MNNYGEYENTYILSVEESIDDRGFKKPILNKISMMGLIKMFKHLFANKIQQINENGEKIEKLETKVNELNKQNEALLEEIRTLKSSIKDMKDQLFDDKTGIIKELVEKTDLEKNRLRNAYLNGITHFCKINDELRDSYSKFARSKELDIFEKIVGYLYSPTGARIQQIYSELDRLTEGERARNFLKDIDEFVERDKMKIENYLKTLNTQLENCLIYPEELKFTSETMEPAFKDISEGKEVLIIKIGYDFPNSNVKPQKAVVVQKD